MATTTTEAPGTLENHDAALASKMDRMSMKSGRQGLAEPVELPNGNAGGHHVIDGDHEDAGSYTAGDKLEMEQALADGPQQGPVHEEEVTPSRPM